MDAWNWPWTEFGYAIAAVAVLILGWGALRGPVARRTRRRRRCPKCWYDLSQTRGVQCNECGHTVKRERHLYRCRRRSWPYIIGIVLLLGSYASVHVKDIRNFGWSAAVPTTVLIVALPEIEERAEQLSEFQIRMLGPKKTPDLLLDELQRRCDANELWNWQWDVLVDQVLRQDDEQLIDSYGEPAYLNFLKAAEANDQFDEDDLARADAKSKFGFAVPETWPDGMDVYGVVTPRHWANWRRNNYTVRDRESGEVLMSREPSFLDNALVSYAFYPWRDGRTLLGQASGDDKSIKLSVSMTLPPFGKFPERERHYDVDIPIVVGGNVEDHVTSIRSQRVDDELQACPEPCLHLRSDGSSMLQIDPSSLNTVLIDEGIDVFAARFEVLDGATVLTTGRAWWASSVETISFEIEPKIRDTAYGDNRVPMSPVSCSVQELVIPIMFQLDEISRRWLQLSQTESAIPITEFNQPVKTATNLILRVSSEPSLALRYRKAKTCWEGQVDLPLRTQCRASFRSSATNVP